MQKKSPLGRARDAYRKGGGVRLIKGAIEYSLTQSSIRWRRTWQSVQGAARRIIPSAKKFRFGKHQLRYFIHPYNTTWKNERAIEIPIVKTHLVDRQDRNVLEFGNVWGRYFTHNHAVVDKYEHWPGVINQDVVDFRPGRTFDFIFSISTLEHVGWDEDPRDPEKVLRALRVLRKLLSPKGRLLITFGVGYNPYLDYLIDTNQVPFSVRHCLKRTSRWNDWEETAWKEIRMFSYGQPYQAANGLVILEFNRN